MLLGHSSPIRGGRVLILWNAVCMICCACMAVTGRPWWRMCPSMVPERMFLLPAGLCQHGLTLASVAVTTGAADGVCVHGVYVGCMATKPRACVSTRYIP